MNTDEYLNSASLYDRCLTPLLKPLRTDIRTFIQHKGYRKIIDICCGTGDQLHLLENDRMELVGIDNSIAMLARARRTCSDNVSLHLLDAEQLDFRDGAFDCGIISFGLHEKHETLRDLIFSNAQKVVRQGGSLIIADYSGESSGFRGSLLGGLLIPLVERIAGKTHYQNYLNWKRQGGLEGFLQPKGLRVDVISRPFAGSVLCCAVARNDDAKDQQKHFALLNRALSADTLERKRNP